MRNFYLKSVSFILLVAMLLIPSLASCKKNESEENSDAEVTTEGTVSTGEVPYESTLPQRDYEGSIFNILCTKETDHFYIETEDAQKSVISEGVHDRNRTVENLYNVELEYTSIPGNSGGSKAFAEKVRTDIQSGAGEYDLILGQSYYCMALALEGCYKNLATSEYLNFDQKWYHHTINDNGTIHNKLYGASGSFVMAQTAFAMCLFYNKDIVKDNGLEENLYELVQNKKWNYETFNQMILTVGSDIDENGIYDNNDSYGLVGGVHTDAALVTASNCPLTYKAPDESVSLVAYNTHSSDVVSTLHELFENNKLYRIKDDLQALNIFTDSRSLFCSIYIDAMTRENVRNMEDAYGVLPFPMYDENQKNYYTYTCRWELFYIPSTCDGEMSEIVTEALNYYSYKELMPKYYETNLQNRLSDTEMDSKMLDIIVDSLWYDFSSFFKTELAGLATFLPSCIETGNVSSNWKTNSKIFKQKLDELFEKYNALN